MSADLLLGGSFQIFSAAPMRDPRISAVPIFVVVDLLTGAVGALYNKAVLSSLRFVDASRLPREVRAGVIGGLIGLVGFYAPSMIGGGDQLTQRALFGAGSIAVVAGVLVLWFVLSVVSYAAATPGGIFAPIPVIGSHLGPLVGPGRSSADPLHDPGACRSGADRDGRVLHRHGASPHHGHRACHGAHRRDEPAPPTLGACAIAMLVAMMLRCTPTYDALTTRAANAAQQNADESPAH